MAPVLRPAAEKRKKRAGYRCIRGLCMSAQGKTDRACAPSRRAFLAVSLAAGGAMLPAFPVGRALAQGSPAKYVLRPGVNPDTLASQVQGGLIFGLTAALHGDIAIANGRVRQGNFNDYRMMRINEAPGIDVHIMPSREAPGGIGEPGCTAGPPSLVNAIAAATGVRIRQLPVERRILAGRVAA
jgi:hypothetical protein